MLINRAIEGMWGEGRGPIELVSKASCFHVSHVWQLGMPSWAGSVVVVEVISFSSLAIIIVVVVVVF